MYVLNNNYIVYKVFLHIHKADGWGTEGAPMLLDHHVLFQERNTIQLTYMYMYM